MAFTTSEEQLVSFQDGKIDIIDRPGIYTDWPAYHLPIMLLVSPILKMG